MSNFSVLVLNVRGLYNAAKRGVVRESVLNSRVSVVCFQESKLSSVDSFVIRELCGSDFDDFAALPVMQTRGGVIMAWKGSVFRGSHVYQGRWSITVLLEGMQGNQEFFLTSVYGPQC